MVYFSASFPYGLFPLNYVVYPEGFNPMPLKFDLDNHYFLLQAFDRLGRHLYRNDWTGMEAFASPSDDPDFLKTRHSELDDQLDTIGLEKTALFQKGGRLERGPEKQQIDQRLFELQKQEQELFNRKSALPSYRETLIADYEQYQRGQQTREILFSGFADKKIKALFGLDQIIDWKLWRGYESFETSVSLSLATAPPEYSTRGDAPVFVSKTSFEQWLITLQPLVESEPEILTIKEQAIRLITKLTETHKRIKKDDCWQAMNTEIPDLTRNMFDDVWKDHAPSHWKKQGRPGN
ncbi:hypothetical protein [Sneathiella sp. HT1-7]|uniref:hypothetical protein n=1 Tax=Sneathiella sp. HT1-7 TaxID=2887192 RepID=UPI001D145381|nr:hypothetical protein [Sneathiella sp. HT1-7]MCC3306606.1 hypothetical protein [Sneathiella sp. HT1-7]